jgi:K+-sensing histidine kinase KdpD
MNALPDAAPRTYVLPANTPTHALGKALQQALGLPLCALRASMESLHDELTSESGGRAHLSGALREVELLGRNVQNLLDFARTPVARPLPCTIDEIVGGTRRLLSRERRERLLVATPPRARAIEIDGPLVSIALQRLLANAFEAGSDHVLFSVEQTSETTRFAIVDSAPGSFDPRWALEPFHTTKPDRLGLGLPLVRRDVAVLEGVFELERFELGGTSAAIRVPNLTSGAGVHR